MCFWPFQLVPDSRCDFENIFFGKSVFQKRVFVRVKIAKTCLHLCFASQINFFGWHKTTKVRETDSCKLVLFLNSDNSRGQRTFNNRIFQADFAGRCGPPKSRHFQNNQIKKMRIQNKSGILSSKRILRANSPKTCTWWTINHCLVPQSTPEKTLSDHFSAFFSKIHFFCNFFCKKNSTRDLSTIYPAVSAQKNVLDLKNSL